MSGKLYEVLAVEDELKKAANSILEETANTFRKKTDHFHGHHKTLQMFDEEKQPEADALFEHKEIVTTVPAKLDYMGNHIVRFLDVIAQKECTNQNANADLKIGDTVLNLPATVLLALERELKKIRMVYHNIPTLNPSYKWVPDADQGADVFKSEFPIKKHRTEKQVNVIPLAPATKEHKEQVTMEKVDTPTGTWTTEHWSGAVTPARKSHYLGRIDKLIRDVKKARMRANEIEVTKCDIGKTIFKYIND